MHLHAGKAIQPSLVGLCELRVRVDPDREPVHPGSRVEPGHIVRGRVATGRVRVLMLKQLVAPAVGKLFHDSARTEIKSFLGE